MSNRGAEDYLADILDAVGDIDSFVRGNGLLGLCRRQKDRQRGDSQP